jgi:hypothetical protein
VANRWPFYEVRPRKDKRGVDLISHASPFERLWYTKVADAIEYAKISQPLRSSRDSRLQ